MNRYVIEYKQRYRRWLEGFGRWDYGEWQQRSAISQAHPGSFAEAKAWLESKESYIEVEIITFYPKDGNPYG
ncbi:MAG: hypothetical protein WCO44_16335 [Bacteroidota bacterium]